VRKTIRELAELVGGEVLGDGNFEVEGISSLEEASEQQITFVSHPRFLPRLARSRAGAVIVAKADWGEGRPRIVVPDPYLAYARIAQLFHPPLIPTWGIAEGAYIHPEARIGRGVQIAPTAWVDRAAVIEDRVVLYPGVCVGEESRIGEDSILYPGVVLYPGTQVGRKVVIHAGSVIGSDGFGYARDGSRYVKIPQMGIVRIDDEVEIGANNTIDRASFGVTWIQRGVKTDNLVHIGHNVVVGEDTVLVAQVGIAGSTVVGRRAVLAGQVGVAGHLRIGDGAMIGPKSGVGKDVPEGDIVSGAPAIPHRHWLRMVQALPRLPDLIRRLRSLEKRVAELEKRDHGDEG